MIVENLPTENARFTCPQFLMNKMVISYSR
jgi:hypothetical protein